MKSRWMFTLLTASLVAGMVGTSYAEVKLDGELRLRGVLVNNEDGAASPSKGGFFEQRARLNADASVDENAKVFIQVQDSRKWGSETANTAGDPTQDTADNVNGGIDLSQGYVEMGKLFGQPLSVRIGRQAIAYGDHRLIGSLEWSNNARRFDAIKFMYKHDVADIDFLFAKVAETGGNWNTDTNLAGIYASLKVVPQNNVDVYLLDSVVTGGGTNFFTLGGRINGAVKDVNVDYTAEIAVQTGDSTGTATTVTAGTVGDKSANAYAIKAGYTIPDVLGGLRIGVEYDAATGDVTADGDDKAFSNLYPTNHYLYGFYDDINWSNIKALSLNVSAKPMKDLKVALEYWKYTRAEKSAGEDDAGSEINLRANHEMSKKINCELGLALRDAGKAAVAFAVPATTSAYGTVPADKSATLAYLMINVKFN